MRRFSSASTPDPCRLPQAALGALRPTNAKSANCTKTPCTTSFRVQLCSFSAFGGKSPLNANPQSDSTPFASAPNGASMSHWNAVNAR